MKRLFVLLSLLFLAACQPAETTSIQQANRLQAQITELLEEVNKRLGEVADLDLEGLCANSGMITAGMDMLVSRDRAYAVVMESQGKTNQALLATGAANQFVVEAQKIKRDCEARAATPPTQPEPLTRQLTDKTASDDKDLAPVTNTQQQMQP